MITAMIINTAMTTDRSLLRLLHLASPALPVGAFAYSQGMEQAVACGWVTNEAQAGAWIGGLLTAGVGQLEVPLLRRLQAAWAVNDLGAVRAWNDILRASRPARQLLDEDRQVGVALARVLVTWGLGEADPWIKDPEATQLALYALAAARWNLEAGAAATAWLFSWAEAQIAAAIRLVPLGQSAGQRLLSYLSDQIPALVTVGMALDDDDIGAGGPAQAIAAAQHETLYSRIFRS